MHPVQQSSCSCLYTPEGNLPKAIPVVLSILAALGIVLIALGLTGHLPFYAGVIGFTLVCTCVAGVLYAICHPQHEAEPLRMVPIQPPEREERTPEEIYFDSLNMHIFPRLSAEDLGAAAQVCTLWQEAAYDELLWKKHWINEHGSDLLPSEFKNYREAFQYHRGIQTLYARGRVINTPLCSGSNEFRLFGDVLCSGHQSNFGFTNLRFWDLTTRKEIGQHKAVSSCPIAIARRRNHLFLAFGHGNIISLNLQNKRIDFSLTKRGRCSFMFVEDHLLVFGNHHGFQVHDADSGNFLYTYNVSSDVVEARGCNMLACAKKGGIIDIIKLDDGSPINRLVVSGNLSALYIHQNRTAIVGHENGMIESWDIETGIPSQHLESDLGSVSRLECIGKLLLSLHGDTLCVRDLKTGRPIRAIKLDSSLQFNDTYMAMLSKGTVQTIDFSIN